MTAVISTSSDISGQQQQHAAEFDLLSSNGSSTLNNLQHAQQHAPAISDDSLQQQQHTAEFNLTISSTLNNYFCTSENLQRQQHASEFDLSSTSKMILLH